jgi:hypothetical protein
LELDKAQNRKFPIVIAEIGQWVAGESGVDQMGSVIGGAVARSDRLLILTH